VTARDDETILRRRELVMLALGWPPCLLAGRPVGAAPERTQPDEPPALTVEDRVYLASSRFEQGFHCAQSVLAAYADEFALPEHAALKMAAALAGGSTVGGECGAVAAGYLVLGLKHAGTMPAFGDVEKERALFDRIRRFVEEFRRRHGALTCRELLGVDVFTAEGLAEGRQRGLFRERCPRYVRDVVTIVESVSAVPGAEAPSGDRP
jgi:C_GCAxxG_C_C family probable redox protein